MKTSGRIYIKNSKGKISNPLKGTKKYPVIYLGDGEVDGYSLTMDHNMVNFYIHPMINNPIQYNLFIYEDDVNPPKIIQNIRFTWADKNVIWYQPFTTTPSQTNTFDQN